MEAAEQAKKSNHPPLAVQYVKKIQMVCSIILESWKRRNEDWWDGMDHGKIIMKWEGRDYEVVAERCNEAIYQGI